MSSSSGVIRVGEALGLILLESGVQSACRLPAKVSAYFVAETEIAQEGAKQARSRDR